MEWNNSAREAEMKQITKRPLLSFCIPAYNASGFLKRSVGSILADLGENREIAEILIIEHLCEVRIIIFDFYCVL